MAEAERNERREDDEEEAPKGTSRRRLFLIGGASLVLLLGLAGGAWFFLTSEKPPSDEELAAKADLVVEDPDGVLSGAQVSLEPFVLNVGSAKTFLQIELVVEYFDFELPVDVALHLARIKDTVIRVISKKDAEMLLSVKGKSDLRVELLAEINRAIDSESGEDIVDLYFTQFVLQFD